MNSVFFRKIKMLRLNIAILAITCLLHNTAQANIIRDSEIEETINLLVTPLKEASGLRDLKIYLIDNDTPNAFTAGGRIIFIHSGLIIKFPDADTLRGVVAHEIGHILGQHVIRREEVVNNYNMAAMAATALGLATAISTGAPGVAAILTGIHVSERSIASYSRGFEATADQAALKLLEKSHQSSIGLINFFQKSKIDSKGNLANPYEQTHPLDRERLAVLQEANKKSQYSQSQNTEDIKYRFHRTVVKLAAYTSQLNELPDCDFKENVDEFIHYMKAIKCFRVGNFDDALNHVHRLLLKRPKDPYYHELKAQILFEAGKAGALAEYTVATELKKDDPLILLGKAIVGITQYCDTPIKLAEFYKDLLFVIQKEPENLLALYYMAIVYEKKGLKGKSYLNSAIIASKLGHHKDARNLATAALKELTPRSPEWYKANDILETNK